MVFVRHAGQGRRRAALTTATLAALIAGVLAAHSPVVWPFGTTVLGAQPYGAVISGRVVDADTDTPVEGAVVVITNIDSGWQQVGVADDRGNYEISGLAAGTYELRASAIGYIGRRFGQRFALDPGAVLDVVIDDVVEAADFALRRGATITGRIVDSDGNPMEAIEVEALRPQLQGEQRILMPLGVAQTDVNGRYRLTGLPPGAYYVGAYDPAADTLVTSSGDPLWPHTYFPGTTTAGAAERVRLDDDATVDQNDFALARFGAVRVIGRLVAPDNADLRSGAVTLSPESDGGVSLGPSLTALARPDGRFEFVQVPPGDHRIRAQASDYSALAPLFATFRITVASGDLTNVTLSLNRGIRLEGQIELEPRANTPLPLDLSGIWVSAPMADGSLSWGVTTTRTVRDGRFLFDSPEGSRVIRVSEVPPPWTLDRVLHRGRDVTDNPLDLVQGDSYTDVRIILTDQTSHLTGLVTDTAGNPVTDRAVVALSANPLRRHPGSRHVQLVYPDLSGRYDFRGLPAGGYVVAAVEELYAGELFERELFEAIAAVGSEVQVTMGRTTTLNIEISEAGEGLAD